VVAATVVAAMYKFLLTPKWIAFHLLCLLAIGGMITAGFWQLGRYQDREDFKAEVRARSEADVVPFESLDVSDPASVEWRPVTVTGTYIADPQFQVVNVSQDGASGTDPVNGLLLADGSVLIINRGFVAGTDAVPPAPEGEVTITGRVRLSQTAGFGESSDDGSQALTQIRRVDIDALSQQFEQDVQPVFVDQVDMKYEPSSVQPVAPPDLDGGPPHLSYTIQWFIFSVAVMVGWVLAVRKSVNERKGKPKKRKPVLIPEQYAS
jgi:cytochrome oxidase assembly protein ShyY1